MNVDMNMNMNMNMNSNMNSNMEVCANELSIVDSNDDAGNLDNIDNESQTDTNTSSHFNMNMNMNMNIMNANEDKQESENDRVHVNKDTDNDYNYNNDSQSKSNNDIGNDSNKGDDYQGQKQAKEEIIPQSTSDSQSDSQSESESKCYYQYQNQKYFSDYETAMKEVLSSFRIMQKKDKIEDFNVAKSFLLSPRRYVNVKLIPDVNEKINDNETLTKTETKTDSKSTLTSALTLTSVEEFKKQIGQQKQHFMQHKQQQQHYDGVSVSNGDNDNIHDITAMNQKHFEMISRSLTYIGDYCAKHQLTKPLFVAWEKVVECGITPRINSLSTYLYRLSTNSVTSSSNNLDTNLEEEGNTNANANAIADPDDYIVHEDATMSNVDIVNQVAYYHDMLYSPTENTVSIRIKSFIEHGKAKEAEELLWSLMPSSSPSINNNLRLRTCFPILEYYCQMGKSNGDKNDERSKNTNISSALKLYQNIKNIPSIHLDQETYILLLSTIAEEGYFSPFFSPLSSSSSIPIEGIVEMGYSPGYGPLLFDQLATEMSDHVLELTNESVKQLRNAFVQGFQNSKSDSNKSAEQHLARNLYYVPYDCHLSPVQGLATHDELVVNRVSIEDNQTNRCPRTHAKLRLITLDNHQRKHVHDTLLEMADDQYRIYDAKLEAKGQKLSKKKKNKKGSQPKEENYAGKHLDSFAKWLDIREGRPFTAIVDGANVAYFGLGSVNYHQVKLMVDALEKMGETPLVIMPQKYTQKKFYLRQGYVQELTQAQLDIIDDLKTSGKFYEVPQRCLDDYYWMLSSVSDQTKSRNGTGIDVSPNVKHHDQERWIGVRPILITNDQMRDHKLQLLEPRLFSRWFSSHIVNYQFAPFIDDISEERNITFVKAGSFSREIQGNPSSLPLADKSSKGDATAWHFPVKDWGTNDRFCVRIPKV